MTVGYETVLDEHEKLEGYEKGYHNLPTMADVLKIEGCCKHIPYVADQHKYTLMHLSAMHGVYYQTAANLREARKHLHGQAFGELCEFIRFLENLRGAELPIEQADEVISNYVDTYGS